MLVNFKKHFAPLVVYGLYSNLSEAYESILSLNRQRWEKLGYSPAEQDFFVDLQVGFFRDLPKQIKPKRQTWRAKNKRSYQVGQTLHLYTGVRSSNQVATLLGERPIKSLYSCTIHADGTVIYIDESKVDKTNTINNDVSLFEMGDAGKEALAVLDGFENFAQMVEFVGATYSFSNGYVEGTLLKW